MCLRGAWTTSAKGSKKWQIWVRVDACLISDILTGLTHRSFDPYKTNTTREWRINCTLDESTPIHQPVIQLEIGKIYINWRVLGTYLCFRSDPGFKTTKVLLIINLILLRESFSCPKSTHGWKFASKSAKHRQNSVWTESCTHQN